MPVDIGPRIGIDGEKQFRDELKNINQSLKTLDSEMKVVTSSFDGQNKSVKQLKKENDVLERSVYTLRDKLKKQEEALKASVNKYGEADAKTLKWRQAVNETTAALNKAERQIKENNLAMQNYSKEADGANGGLSSFIGTLKGIGVIGIAIKGVSMLTDAFREVGTAVKDAAIDAAAYADDINTMSAVSGLSVKELQEFSYASELIDVDVDTLTGSLSKLTKNMNTARKGTGDAATAFTKFGISIKDDVTGELRNNKEVFYEVITALGAIENETERDALAMSIFGKSAQELNPLILAGADFLQRCAQEAADFGLVLDDVQLNALNNFNDDIYRMQKEFEGVKMQFILDNLDTFEELLSYAPELFEAAERAGELFLGVLNGIAAVLDVIIAKAPSVRDYVDNVRLPATGGGETGTRTTPKTGKHYGTVNIYPRTMSQSELNYAVKYANGELGGAI